MFRIHFKTSSGGAGYAKDARCIRYDPTFAGGYVHVENSGWTMENSDDHARPPVRLQSNSPGPYRGRLGLQLYPKTSGGNAVWPVDILAAAVAPVPHLMSMEYQEVRASRALFAGTWDAPLLLRGNYLWVDGKGAYRMKRTAPTSATDGNRMAERLVKEWRSGQVVPPTWASSAFTALAVAVNRVYAVPIEVDEDVPFSEFLINVTVAAPAGSFLRLGLMGSIAGGYEPDAAALLYSVAIVSDVVGVRVAPAPVSVVPRGIYWILVQAEGGAVTVTANVGTPPMVQQFPNGPAGGYYKDAQVAGSITWAGAVQYAVNAVPRPVMRVL
jgi:hypothetical protein